MRARRKRARLRLSLLLLILGLVLIATFFWLIRQPYLRVHSITVFGADTSLESYAWSELAGSYLGIIPRDSIIFLPEGAIRRDILVAHSEIAAVSLFRESFTSISIKAIERVPIARWCGSTYSPQASSTIAVQPECYVFDGNGYLYAGAASSSAPLNSFVLYDPLIGSSSAPLLATVASPDRLPAAFAFARELASFGSPVAVVALRGDEVDDYMEAGPRITYVLGQEQQAYDALDSASGDLNFRNGSIDYVDLRFPGDVYVKKVGQ